MNGPQQLERRAVVSAEVHGKRAGTGFADQPRRQRAPGWIGDLRLPDIKLRDLARRKHGQRASLLQPLDGLLQGFKVLVRGRGVVERIDVEAVLAQFGDSFEQRVRQHPHIRPDARQKHAQGGIVEHAKRMVRNGDQRTFGGDTFQIGGLDPQVHLHRFQQGLQAKSVRSRLHPVIEFAHFSHGDQVAGKSRKAGKLRRTSPKTSPTVPYAWRSSHNKFSPSSLCSRVKRLLKVREQCPKSNSLKIRDF